MSSEIVCVRVRERDRQTDRERDRQTDGREKDTAIIVTWDFPLPKLPLFFNNYCHDVTMSLTLFT